MFVAWLEKRGGDGVSIASGNSLRSCQTAALDTLAKIVNHHRHGGRVAPGWALSITQNGRLKYRGRLLDIPGAGFRAR